MANSSELLTSMVKVVREGALRTNVSHADMLSLSTLYVDWLNITLMAIE